MEIFTKGSDNALWHRRYLNSTWTDWNRIEGKFTSTPCAVSSAPNKIDVFIKDQDNFI